MKALPAILASLGFLLQAHAAERPPRAAEPVSPSAETRTNDVAAVLRDALARDDKGAVSINARQVLSAPVPPPGSEPRVAAERKLALEYLGRIGELGVYVEELEKAAAAKPTALAFLRVGEASADRQVSVTAYKEAFRLDPENATAAKALLEKVPSPEKERPPWFEALLAVQPEEAIDRFLGPLRSTYANMGGLPALAARIDAAPFRMAGPEDRVKMENQLLPLVGVMNSMHQPEAAAITLRKALSLVGTPYSAAMRRQLLLQLTEQGVEAFRGSAAAAYFVPDPVPAAVNTPEQRNRILDHPIFDEQALKMSREAGLAPAILQRANGAAARHPTARGIALYLRVLDRDPQVLEEILAMGNTERSPSIAMPWALAVTRALAEWPEASQVCLQMLTVYKDVLRSSISGSVPAGQGLAQIAMQAGQARFATGLAREMIQDAQDPRKQQGLRTLAGAFEVAIALRDPALMRECNALLIKQIEASIEPHAEAIEQGKRIVGVLLDARRVEETEALLKALAGNTAAVTGEINASWRSTIFALQAEWGLQRGEVQSLRAVAFVDHGRSTARQAAIVWDLSVQRFPHMGPAILFAEAPNAIAEAEDWTVELRFGETKENSRFVARVPDAGPRGLWRGAWPATSGFWSVVLSHKGQKLTGPPTPFLMGENLLRPLPAAVLKSGAQPPATKEGGPAWDQQYLAFPAANPRAKVTTPVGQPVKLLPGRQYEITAWLHHESDFTLEFTVRYLDANRKPIRVANNPIDLNPWRWWHYLKFRVGPMPGNNPSLVIPADAVYLEPVVNTSGDAGDVAGMSVVLVP